MLEPPDLDDYQWLAKGLPGVGLIVIWGLIRGRISFVDLGHGLLIGLIVGSVLVSILVIQLHLWKDMVARAVVEYGNPRLPLGFVLAVVVYFVGVVAAAVLVGSRVPPSQYSLPGGVGVALAAGACMPWVVLLWPMQEIRDRADVLYRERDKEKFGKPQAKDEQEDDGQEQEDVIV